MSNSLPLFANDYNIIAMHQSYAESLARELACLYTDNNKQKPVNYYNLDRLKINKILEKTFGIDIYGKKACSIITDFIGYSSFKYDITTFESFIKKCNSTIQKNNRKHPANQKAIAILQTSYDSTKNTINYDFLYQLKQIAKTYYIAFRIIFRKETLGEAIKSIAKELNGHSIMTLLVRAQGTETSIQLGYENFYTVRDVKASDFSSLDPKASIIFDSHLPNCILTKIVPEVQLRPVFARTGKSCDSYLTLCCHEHGYATICFDDSANQITRRFTFENGKIAEEFPCYDIAKETETISKNDNDALIMAAEAGDVSAKFDLTFPNSKDNKATQRAKVAFYLKEAQQEHSLIQYNLGNAFYHGKGAPKSSTEAEKWYLKAAEQGHRSAQYNLGLLYFNRDGIHQSYAESAAWFMEAAEQGHILAQYNLGNAYCSGQGVFKSFAEGAKWYIKAAEQGDLPSQYKLGILYYDGNGVEQSFENAIKWMKQSAEQGFSLSQTFLGTLYFIGEIIPKSYDESEKWLKKAAEQGDETAKYTLSIIAKK